MGDDGYHRLVCDAVALEPADCVVMGTAAHMQYASTSTFAFRDLSATAVVTAGVSGNAGRASDPAQWYEQGGDYVNVAAADGTINTMLHVSMPLTEAALAHTVVMITEAKTAALMDLAIPSRSSNRLATGTGTDQFCIAAPAEGPDRLTWTGKHTKAGELIGAAVVVATREALRWQNGLEVSLTRGIHHALGRHGLTEERLAEGLARHLAGERLHLAERNAKAIAFDAQVAAAAYAIAAVLDRRDAGTLPPDAADEAVLNQAALLGSVIAARPDAYAGIRTVLAAELRDPVELVCAGIAHGWAAKWP